MKNFFLSLLLITILQSGYSQNNLKIFGHISTGPELNRNIRLADHSKRSNFDRLLLKMNFGFKYLYDNFTFSGRVSTGNTAHPNSPYIDLGNSYSRKSILLDKAYIKYKHSGWTAWIGKNSINLWKTNEILWDNDLKPEGIGIGKKLHFYGDYVPEFKINTGYFFINSNPYNNTKIATTFDRQNFLSFVQLKTAFSINQHHLILSPTYFYANISKTFDYDIFAVMFRYKFLYDYNFYADYYHNFSTYENQVDVNLQNQKSGFDLGLGWHYRKFMLKLMYAYIEKYAVIDFLSQDNWLLPMTNDSQFGSNFKGINSRFSYKINRNFSVIFNVWYAKQIQYFSSQNGLFEATRMRLEFDFKF